uniref:Reverse transcriptase Ty1/copia-type domain-containing protein n=1 Tax=Lactuca sativa TaxID=4236 RepID=A0A9R1UZU9_LACSA|nr:hypothetical protein LSAT_V11C700373290 [Lactuca sativa]
MEKEDALSPYYLKVAYVLSKPMPEFAEDENLEATRRRSKWDNDDYICRGHILNGMSDSLFDIYQNVETAKQLWDSLESKYMTEDALSKKFFVSNYFKHNLKHNNDELTLTQLGSHLRIEESLRTQELDNNPKGKNQVGSSFVNMVEGERSKNPKKSNGKRKFKGKDDKSSNKKAKLNYIFVIFEAFYVQDDDVAWWVDLGATSHICKDLRWFKECQPIEDGYVVKMGNVATETIKGLGSILLYFISGKCLCLNNVLYVLGIRKNLVSEIVLNNCGYKQVLESDKYIKSRHGSFMSFGYVCNGMIKLNINYPSYDNSVCMASSSTSNNFNKSDLWHARPEHIHYKRLKDMSKMSLIPAFDINNEKCKTCMLTKITRQVFKDVIRESKVLELIHSDLWDFLATSSLGNKKYVVIFIDDASRYYYVYLLHSKDEALDKFKIYKQEVLNLSYLKVWGYRAIVRLTEPKKTLGERGIDCIFIGYGEHSKAYRFYVLEPNDSVSVNTAIESKDAIFDEERFTSIPRPRDMIQQSFSKKTTQAEDASGVEGKRDETVSQRQYCFIIEEDPKTFSEAMASRDIHFWKEAIQALGCKWILKRKMKVAIDKYKARLVIQGFRQKEDIDFFDTYAHIARLSTIRLLLALVVIHNLVIHQMDVKTAFLNGELDEEIYMKQPEGFEMPGNEHKVYPSLKLLPNKGSQVST